MESASPRIAAPRPADITKRRIVDDILAGQVSDRTIAFNRDVSPEHVRTVRQSLRAVRELRGADPAVVYANFSDVLPLSFCGQ
jgi:hypothetical protein